MSVLLGRILPQRADPDHRRWSRRHAHELDI